MIRIKNRGESYFSFTSRKKAKGGLICFMVNHGG